MRAAIGLDRITSFALSGLLEKSLDHGSQPSEYDDNNYDIEDGHREGEKRYDDPEQS